VAKSLAQAADAAASKPASAPAGARPVARPPSPVVMAARTVAQAKKESKQAGRSMLTPLKKFSSVLWLELTGSFFALIAAFLGEGVWRMREAFKAAPSSHEAQKAYVYTVVFALFAYFAVSSFVRANRRSKQDHAR
jgi:hypothetical protein